MTVVYTGRKRYEGGTRKTATKSAADSVPAKGALLRFGATGAKAMYARVIDVATIPGGDSEVTLKIGRVFGTDYDGSGHAVVEGNATSEAAAMTTLGFTVS